MDIFSSVEDSRLQYICSELQTRIAAWHEPMLGECIYQHRSQNLRGLLGQKIYLLHVVEFQKRGLPHAHLALRVEPQPSTTDEIDEVISAEVPPESEDSDDQRYHDLVLWHMIHHHTRACLDENRHRRKNFQATRGEDIHRRSGICALSTSLA